MCVEIGGKSVWDVRGEISALHNLLPLLSTKQNQTPYTPINKTLPLSPHSALKPTHTAVPAKIPQLRSEEYLPVDQLEGELSVFVECGGGGVVGDGDGCVGGDGRVFEAE